MNTSVRMKSILQNYLKTQTIIYPYLSVAVSGINYPFIYQQEICLLVCNRSFTCSASQLNPRFYVSTSKSIIKALINMHSFEIQLSPIG
ncbi:TPA: hypothetical protein MG752_26315 [Klebsiella pneumoniae]|nr:hypothetical protein [Klebsiella pneumoniae]HBZ2753813.1 hypothetical protein [Klebsiella pneumoniae]